MNKKRQQIVQHDTDLCMTIPQKIVEAFDISTKRFFVWKKSKDEILGTLGQSETVVTTRVRMGDTKRYRVDILHGYVTKFKLLPTKKGGPMATFEWDDTTVQVRIPLQR
jgi:hypothetical protein